MRKKRGLLFKLRLWRQVVIPMRHAQASADDRGRHRDPAALLRVPELQWQADAVGRLGGNRRDPSHAARAEGDRDGELRLVVRPRQRQTQGHLPHERE